MENLPDGILNWNPLIQILIPGYIECDCPAMVTSSLEYRNKNITWDKCYKTHYNTAD